MSHPPLSIGQRLSALNAMVNEDQREAAILAALEDEAAPVRDYAIRLAARYLEPRLLGELVADDENAVLRNAALAALERQGPYAVNHLQQMLAQDDVEVVMFALQVLARIGTPISDSTLLPLIQHSDANVAQSAIETLGRLRAREAVPALLPLLETDLWIQMATIEALGEIGDPRAVTPLLALVPDGLLGELAVQALGKLADPTALRPLLQRLREAEGGLRDALLQAVGDTLERHPTIEEVAIEFGRELRDDHAPESLLHYLVRALEGEGRWSSGTHENGLPPVRDDRSEARGGGPLLRAAAALVIAARIEPLYSTMLLRVDRRSARWMAALCRLYPRTFDDRLEELLVHEDPRVRRGMLVIGNFAPQHSPVLLQRLHDEEADVRTAACQALALLADPATIPSLLERLRDGRPEERAAAAEALGRMPGDALAELAPCLEPAAGADVQIAALAVIEHSRSHRFEARVVELTHAPAGAVRLAALRAVAQLDGARFEVALLRALADRDQAVQVEVLGLLVSRGGEKAIATLVALLSSSDSLRYHIIRALGRLKARQAAVKLQSFYPESPLHERVEILSALIRIAPPGITAFLKECLRESEGEIRRLAAQGLAQLIDESEYRVLVSLAADADWSVRNEAARGLGLLSLEETRGTLLTLVRDVEPVVAHTARAALEKLSGGAVVASA